MTRWNEDPEYILRLCAALLACNDIRPPDYTMMAAMFANGQTPSNMEDRFRDIRALARAMRADYNSPATQAVLAARRTGRKARSDPFVGKGASISAGRISKKRGRKGAAAAKEAKAKGKEPSSEDEESGEECSGEVFKGFGDGGEDGGAGGAGAAGTNAAGVTAQ